MASYSLLLMGAQLQVQFHLHATVHQLAAVLMVLPSRQSVEKRQWMIWAVLDWQMVRECASLNGRMT